MNDISPLSAGYRTLSQEPPPGHARQRRSWRWLIGLVLLAVVVAGGWFAYRASVLQSAPKLILAADRLLGAGKFDAARSQVSAILSFAPDQPDALSVIGRCLFEEGKPDEAIPILARVPSDSAAFEKAGFPLASAYLQTADLERGEAELRRYLKRYPAADAAREELRWLCFNQFRPRETVALLEERLALNPGSHQVLADLLDSEYRQQVPFEGVQYLEQIEQKKPGQGSVGLALGYAYWRTGRVEQARPMLRTALTARPNDSHTRFVVAAFLIEQGQLAEAEEILSHSPIPDDDDRYWSLRSQISEQKNDAAASLAHLDQAIRRHGTAHRYATRRASLLRKLARGRPEIEAASSAAYELLKVDRELADIVESLAHHHPTRSSAQRLAVLCGKVGKARQAAGWRMLAEQLPEGSAAP